MAIVRAIDVGYGNTKYTTSDGQDGGDIECSMFPSVAPITAATDDKGDWLGKRESVLVSGGDGKTYEVGPDAMLGMPKYSSRSLDNEYVKQPYYLALARGAMHYMKVDQIDYLMVGLPVGNMGVAAELESRLKGKHDLPGRTIEVGTVKVIPQPVGGMFDFGVRNKMLREIESGLNLLCDPGYFTLDWVTAHGTKIVWHRSNSAEDSGMSAILRAISKELADRTLAQYGKTSEITEQVLNEMDKAILENRPMIFKGRSVKLDDLLQAGQTVVSNGLANMKKSVGSYDDITRVIIVGGASHFYEKAITEVFDGYDVFISKNAVYANVRGFQMMGNQLAKRTAYAKTEQLAA